MTGGMNKVLSGVAEGINWLSGANKNAKGKTMWNQLGNWLKKNVIGSGNTSSLTDVMDANGNFSYDDNSTGLTRLWNNITGKSSRDYNTAVTNYTNQYNAPVNQRELYEKAGLNTNLLGNGGVQTLADTSAIGVNGSTFNDALQNLSGIWNIGKGAFDLSQTLKHNKRIFKGLDIKNLADEMDLSSHKLSAAINNFKLRPDMLKKSLDNLVDSLDNESAQLHLDSTTIANNQDYQDNVVPVENQNKLDEAYDKKEKLVIEALKNTMDKISAEGDLDNLADRDSEGNYHIKPVIKDKRAKKLLRDYDKEDTEYLIQCAELFRKNAEKAYYEASGNTKYPDWNVDIMSDEVQKYLYETISNSDMKPWQKNVLFALILVANKKL